MFRFLVSCSRQKFCRRTRWHSVSRDGRCRGKGAALRRRKFGDFEVQANDVVFEYDDGCLFVKSENVEELLATARSIWGRERQQAEAIKAGRALRAQLDFA